jgi:hypothetical protein
MRREAISFQEQSASRFTNKPYLIQHKEVIAELTARCKDFMFWYKLYVDDLVMCVSHIHIEALLDAL